MRCVEGLAPRDVIVCIAVHVSTARKRRTGRKHLISTGLRQRRPREGAGAIFALLGRALGRVQGALSTAPARGQPSLVQVSKRTRTLALPLSLPS